MATSLALLPDTSIQVLEKKAQLERREVKEVKSKMTDREMKVGVE